MSDWAVPAAPMLEWRPTSAVTAAGDTLTWFTLDSGAPGPCVTFVAGIHGNEIAGILTLKRLVHEPMSLSRGLVRVLPVAHPSAHAANTRLSPRDDLNLARVFPGSATGSPTEQLAAAISAELIAGSDVLVDLHTSAPDSDMPFFAGCLADGSPECPLAVELCDAFGAGTVWTHPSTGLGRTLTVAHELGIPAIYVESPRGGVLTAQMLDAYRDGTLRVLAFLGMVDAASVPAAIQTTVRLHGNGNTDLSETSRSAGYFVPQVDLLSSVTAGDTIAMVYADDGSVAQVCTAPQDGVIAVLRQQAVIAAGDMVFQLATPSH